MRGIGIAGIVVLGLAACTQDLSLPLEAPEGGSALFAVPRPGQDPLLLALERGDAVGGIAAGEQEELWALSYPLPLARLGLRSGAVRDSVIIARRPFPPGFEARVYVAGQETRDVSADEVGRVFPWPLPDVLPDSCEDQGGCFRVAARTEQSVYCELPCAITGAPAPPEPPAAPEPPVLTPCPANWSDLGGPGPRCAPPLDTSCAPGSAWWRTSAACEPIGTACPSGDWPEPLPSGPLLFVKRSAAPGGDGSQSAPYLDLPDAIASNPAAGTTILLAPGQYGPATIPDMITVRGVCASQVAIASNGGTGVVIEGGQVALADLRIQIPNAPAALSIARDHTPTTVSLDGVELRADPAVHAIYMGPRGHLLAHALVIRGAATGIYVDASNPPELWPGPTTVELTQAEITDVLDAGISLSFSQALLVARELRIAHTIDPFPDGRRPAAIYARIGAQVDVQDAALVDVRAGLIAHNGAKARLRNVYVGGRPDGNADAGSVSIGVEAGFGDSVVDLQDARIVRMSSAMFALLGGAITASDVLVSDVFHGVRGDDHASLTLSRVSVVGRIGVGVETYTDTLLQADDLLLDNSAGPLDCNFGIFLHQASGTIRRARISSPVAFGVTIEDASGQHPIDLSDVLIEDVHIRVRAETPTEPQNGDCLNTIGVASMSRLACRRPGRDGLNLGAPTADPNAPASIQQHMFDLQVEGAGRFGVAIANGGGVGERVRVLDSHGAGLLVQLASVHVKDLQVGRSQSTSFTVPLELPGIGLWLGPYDLADLARSELVLERALIQDSAEIGVRVRDGAELSCTNVLVDSAPLGLDLNGPVSDPKQVGDIGFLHASQAWRIQR